jgi:hypothetical protein
MKSFGILLAALAIFAFTGVTQAAKKNKGDGPVIGSITNIDGNTLKITTLGNKKNPGEEKTFTVDDKTTIFLDGKEAKLTDLKAGQGVTILATGTTVTKIDASSSGPEKKKKKNN